MALSTLLLTIVAIVLAVANAQNKFPGMFGSLLVDPTAVTECSKSSGFNLIDVMKLKPGDKPTKEMSCFLKCIAESGGFIDKNGQVVKEKVDDIKFPPRVPEDKLKEVKDCALKVPAVKECEDMNQFLDCIQLLRSAKS